MYNKNSNFTCLDEFGGSNIVNAGKIRKTKIWNPPSVGLLKWNTDASMVGKKRLPQLVLSVEIVQVISFLVWKKIGDNNIVVAETLAIQEGIATVFQKQLAKIIIESDLLVTIRLLMERLTSLLN